MRLRKLRFSSERMERSRNHGVFGVVGTFCCHAIGEERVIVLKMFIQQIDVLKGTFN
jgi:hypothetical protein